MKNWIKKLLGIAALEAGNKKMSKELEDCKEQLKFYKDNLFVGLDLNYGRPSKRETSWAVVCIQGKSDFVQFIDLTSEQARDIKRFLERFHRRNITVDQPPFMVSLKPDKHE